MVAAVSLGEADAEVVATAPGDPVIGVSPGGSLLSLDDAEIRSSMLDIAALGAAWVRVDLAWPSIERSPGQFDWSASDQIVAEARAAGLQVLALASYTPDWAENPNGNDWPEDPADYGRFVGEAVDRYGADVAAWELWNEPNNPVFTDDPSPESYAPLLVAGTEAIRARAPSATVISGGIAPAVDDPDAGTLSPASWLTRLVEALDGTLPVDAIGIHPYSFPAFPDGDEPWNFFGQLDALRATLTDAGVGDLPFWATEFGAPTDAHPQAVDEARQAEILLRGLAVTRARADLDAYFVFSLDDSHSVSIGDGLSEGFGLRRTDGTAKPAYASLAAQLHDVQPNGEGYWLLGRDGEVHAFGDVAHFADLDAEAVGLSAVGRDGLLVLTADGQVVARGTAEPLGTIDPSELAEGERPIAVAEADVGYWLFTNRGRVHTFGGATFHGDLRSVDLAAEIIDAVATESGCGYLLLGADGGIFAFGDAAFHGSLAETTLNAPVVGISADGDGDGYWLVASDGGVFAFASAFRGSVPGVLAPGVVLNAPIIDMVPAGDGYLIVGADGGVFDFSGDGFRGSLGGVELPAPVIAGAASG